MGNGILLPNKTDVKYRLVHFVPLPDEVFGVWFGVTDDTANIGELSMAGVKPYVYSALIDEDIDLQEISAYACGYLNTYPGIDAVGAAVTHFDPKSNCRDLVLFGTDNPSDSVLDFDDFKNKEQVNQAGWQVGVVRVQSENVLDQLGVKVQAKRAIEDAVRLGGQTFLDAVREFNQREQECYC